MESGPGSKGGKRLISRFYGLDFISAPAQHRTDNLPDRFFVINHENMLCHTLPRSSGASLGLEGEDSTTVSHLGLGSKRQLYSFFSIALNFTSIS